MGYSTRVPAWRYRGGAPSDPRGSANPLRGTWLWLGKSQFRNVPRGELYGEEEVGLEAEYPPFDKGLLASDDFCGHSTSDKGFQAGDSCWAFTWATARAMLRLRAHVAVRCGWGEAGR